MSLSRAFTKRSKRTADMPPSTSNPVTSPFLARAISFRNATLPHDKQAHRPLERNAGHPVGRKDGRPLARNPSHSFDRRLISGPVELISTTNMLSYNAPDIVIPQRQISSASNASASSSHDSVSDSDSSARSRQSNEAFTDASSVDESSSLTSSPVSPNHLSNYFKSAQQAQQLLPPRPASADSIISHRRTRSVERRPQTSTLAPAIPKRALSHSKSAHLELARKRSVQHLGASPPTSKYSAQAGPPVSPGAVREQRGSFDMFRANPPPDPNHPFGKELEQLTEVAEEFGNTVKDVEAGADAAVMQNKGLLRFCATDYLAEIQPLFHEAFPAPAPMAWI